ncbi:acyl-CoA N-acyltransferase [Podospora fimiseda]|uniref:Acyl-CoA N-acyltransferase n=1 Tax=Podospora fimiseda TaxID=252190 RepID=A0AAN7H823_9PEZI|nr:acyl-CoA N-acyltransferase [Podospora fimiseda]
MALSFRLATPADALHLTSLINTSFRNDPTTDVFLSPSHEGIDVTSLPEMEAIISDPSKTTILATVPNPSDAAEKMVGHCSVRLLDDKNKPSMAWFGMLAVDISSQGQGVGSQLLKYAEWYARTELKATRMEFDVVWTRKGLIDWYKSMGYSETGETRAFPYDRHAGWESVLRGDLGFLLMEKELV